VLIGTVGFGAALVTSLRERRLYAFAVGACLWVTGWVLWPMWLFGIDGLPNRLDQLNQVPVQDVILSKSPVSLLTWFLSVRAGQGLLGAAVLAGTLSLWRRYRQRVHFGETVRAMAIVLLFWVVFAHSMQKTLAWIAD
jgi:hypothetical protein